MGRPKKVETDYEQLVDGVDSSNLIKESKKKTEFYYENTSNIAYDLNEETSEIELKAQVPFRMNPGDLRCITAGLKIYLPNGVVGIILNNSKFDSKNQIAIVGNTLISSCVETDVTVILKNLSNINYKIYNVGDVLAKLVLLKSANLNF